MATATDNRLAPALAEAQKRAAARLAPKLEAANTKTYLRQMQATAKAFGQPAPKAITDKDVLAAIAARAMVSAASIVATQSDRMAALVQEHGSLAAAQQPFKDWEKIQLASISAYESSMTTHAAQADFQAANPDLAGTEHLEPREAAVNDECQDAIDMGDVPIGTLGDSWPAHFNCPHYVQRDYQAPDDTSVLWVGGD